MLALGEFLLHPLLEVADRPHRPVGAQQLLSGQSLPLHGIGHVLLLNGSSYGE